MSVEFIGYVSAREQTEILDLPGPAIDPAYIAATALVHEQGGFDRVLVAAHSTSPDSTLIAQYAASVTSTLGLLIAHRPGFTAPTLAARQLATLDHLSRGRVAVHIITGGNDRELEADGDHLSKVERYQRTSEYLKILRREWAGGTPFDHDGEFYRLRGASSVVLPFQPNGIPVYFGGASEEAIRVAGELADGYALWGEPLANAAELVGKVQAAAQHHHRSLRFSVSFRPIIADTEEEAWERAASIQQQIEKRQAAVLPAQNGIALDHAGPSPTEQTLPTNEGSRRLQAIAAKSARHDDRLWTGVTKATGGRWNSTSLVGTADQVAESLLQYYRLGIETFLIRGFDPLTDAVRYGRDLIPRVRALVEQEDTLRRKSG
ncbi:LLM class flavin-dependent oxidoreductase [Gluconobacter frateurii]|uniref:Alkanesulfonate monooxygenase n=1 Tax=Gluconobacter frateurii NRIC 0228 TaxID=1307946 RepID=A0ABQ0QEX1_9PROT|nr:LLM class flavin-dependent oxidoreductase [Gluconobacter frateurii]GBR16699.1 alkanesulfonate monooxygenase [Gluconobacter frateurii NRIC 0228]GLP90638.1 alkanesulfonate monooxygenase [Gluconobacter frateurii]